MLFRYEQIDKGKFIFNEKYEDIHLNIEKKLFDIIGSPAGFMHTERTRNDQIVTDFKLWVKDSSKDLLKDIKKMMKALLRMQSAFRCLLEKIER